MILATEIWSMRTYVRGQSAVRAWRVTGASTEENARTAIPVVVNSSHPQDARLKVMPTPEVRTESNGLAYVVVATYGNPDTGTYVAADTPLLDQPMKWIPEFMLTSEVVYRDPEGNPLVNAAGDPFDGVTEDHEEIVMVGTRYESTWEAAKWFRYRRAVNTDSFKIPKVGLILPGQACLTTYAATAAFDVKSTVVPVQYKLWIRDGKPVVIGPNSSSIRDGHVRAFLNAGHNGWSSATERAPFYDKDGPVSDPIRLDATGRPMLPQTFKVGQGKKDAVAYSLKYLQRGDRSLIETSADATYVKYMLKALQPFAPLNLSA